MQLNRPLRIITGILAFLPIGYLIVAIAAAMFFFDEARVDALRRGAFLSDELGVIFIAALVVTGVVLLLNYAAMIFLMAHAGMNKRLVTGWKVAWILLLLFGNIVVYPIYWIREVHWDGSPPPMTPRARLAFALLACFPLVWLAFIIVVQVGTGATGSETERITMLWAVVFDFVFFPMWIYTVVHIVRNHGLSTAAKIFWIAVVVCACLLSMPVYWFFGARLSGTAPGRPAGRRA